MKNVVIFGYGYEGVVLAEKLYKNSEYNLYGFADNSIYKQRNFVYGEPIKSIAMLKELDKKIGISVIIASNFYRDIIKQCEDEGIHIDSVYIDGKLHSYPLASFDRLDLKKNIKLYAGDIVDSIHYGDPNLYALSINRWDEKHIQHDIRNPYPIPDNSIYSYEAEEVFEYIDESILPDVIQEIYRVIKPGSCLRISMPDYNSPYIRRRSMRTSEGQVIFDVGGGGNFNEHGVVNGGQVYFATYENFSKILDYIEFSKIDWMCYHSEDGKCHKKYIDMSRGYLNRVRNDSDGEDYCIVVDCYK